MAPFALLPLIQFVLPVSSGVFLRLFWLESAWYQSFLSNSLGNRNINIQPWAALPVPSVPISCPTGEMLRVKTSLQRRLSSLHPMEGSVFKQNFGFLGLIPDFAPSFRQQTLHYLDLADEFLVEEEAHFSDLPLVNTFRVCTQWRIAPADRLRQQTRVEVFFGVKWLKPSLVAPLVSSQVRSELREVLQQWRHLALTRLQAPSVSMELQKFDKVNVHSRDATIPVVFQAY